MVRMSAWCSPIPLIGSQWVSEFFSAIFRTILHAKLAQPHGTTTLLGRNYCSRASIVVLIPRMACFAFSIYSFRVAANHVAQNFSMQSGSTTDLGPTLHATYITSHDMLSIIRPASIRPRHPGNTVVKFLLLKIGTKAITTRFLARHHLSAPPSIYAIFLGRQHDSKS